MRGARDEFIRIIFETLYFSVRKTVSVFIAFITFTNERYEIRSYEYIKNNYCRRSVFKFIYPRWKLASSIKYFIRQLGQFSTRTSIPNSKVFTHFVIRQNMSLVFFSG